MTPQEIAAAILQLYANDAQRWTQRVIARGPDGKDRDLQDHDCTCYCLMGATLKVAPGLPDERSHFYRDFTLLAQEMGMGDSVQDIARWNDAPDRTFDHLMGVLNAMANGAQTLGQRFEEGRAAFEKGDVVHTTPQEFIQEVKAELGLK